MFHGNKTTASSFYCLWICICEGIPFPAIFPSFLVCWKTSCCLENPSNSYHYSQGNFKFVTSKNQQNAFPKLHILKYYVTRLYFLKDQFYHVKKLKRWGLVSRASLEFPSPLPSTAMEILFVSDVLCNKKSKNLTLTLNLTIYTD